MSLEPFARPLSPTATISGEYGRGSFRKLYDQMERRPPTDRGPFSFAVTNQRVSVARGCGARGRIVRELEIQGDSHVVANSWGGQVRPGVIFTHCLRS